MHRHGVPSQVRKRARAKLLRVSSIDPGFDIHNVLLTRVARSPNALVSPARTRAGRQEVLDRVRQIPGVPAVAIADLIPMSGEDVQIGYWTTPAAAPAKEMPLSFMTLVTRDYPRVIGIPLLRGRFLTDRDRVGNSQIRRPVRK